MGTGAVRNLSLTVPVAFKILDSSWPSRFIDLTCGPRIMTFN